MSRVSLLTELKEGRISRRTFLKRAVATGFSLPAVLTALNACAPTPTPPKPTETPVAKATEIPVVAATPTKIGGAITVTYMSSKTRDLAAMELAPKFEEKFGTKVTIAAFPWKTLVQNNTTDLLTGAGLYTVQSGAVNANLWNLYEPLEPYMERDNWKMPYVPGLADRRSRSEGKILGALYEAGAYSMFVRTDLLLEAGVDFAVDKAWTWDQFDEIIAELHARYSKQGISGFVLAGGAVDQNGPFFWGRYDGYHWNKAGLQQHDPDKGIKALERLKKHLQYCPENVRGLSIDEANAVFLQGKACIIECWAGFMRAAAKDPQQSKVIGKWSQVPFPVPGFNYLSLWELLINKFAQNKEAGWQWIKWYISPENEKYFFKKYGMGPTMVTTLEDPELLAEASNDFPAVKANLARACRPVVTDEAEWFLDDVVNEVINGLISSEEGIKKVNESWATMQGTRAEWELAHVQGLVEK
ncbi:MAG: extracellular solute-binding protein [Anaerolineae bacterium]